MHLKCDCLRWKIPASYESSEIRSIFVVGSHGRH